MLRAVPLLVLTLPVVLSVGVLPVEHADASSATSSSWFHDPLTTTRRAALVPVPEHPRSVHGKVQRTRALFTSHDGLLAVPATWAGGHQLEAGQAVTLSRRGMFAAGSSRPTPATRARVARLGASLAHVTAVTCEGYTDFGADAARRGRLARARAARVCTLLAASRPGLTTRAVGFGQRVPVLVGGKRSQRAANRRVVVVATQDAPVAPSGDHQPQQATVPGPPTLTSVTGSGLRATLVFTSPASGGSPITGYEWSTDLSTWTPLTTTGSSPFTVTLSSLPVGTATYHVRAVNAVGHGPASGGLPGTVLEVPNAPSVFYTNVFCNGASEMFNQMNADPVFNSATITGVEYRLDGAQTWTSPTDLALINNQQYRWSLPESGLCTGSHSIEMRFTSANGPGASLTRPIDAEPF